MLRMVKEPDAVADESTSLSIVPRAGCAVVHFPTTSAKYHCVIDERTRHASEPAISPKFIVQQFIWSCPLDEAKGAISAYVGSLLAVARSGEKERGEGGVVFVDPVLRLQYRLPNEFLSMSGHCGQGLVDQLGVLATKQGEKGRVVVFEIEDDAQDFGRVWSVSRETGADGWHASSPRVKMPLAGGIVDLV